MNAQHKVNKHKSKIRRIERQRLERLTRETQKEIDKAVKEAHKDPTNQYDIAY
jgi:hypothetical protein